MSKFFLPKSLALGLFIFIGGLRAAVAAPAYICGAADYKATYVYTDTLKAKASAGAVQYCKKKSERPSSCNQIVDCQERSNIKLHFYAIVPFKHPLQPPLGSGQGTSHSSAPSGPPSVEYCPGDGVGHAGSCSYCPNDGKWHAGGCVTDSTSIYCPGNGKRYAISCEYCPGDGGWHPGECQYDPQTGGWIGETE